MGKLAYSPMANSAVECTRIMSPPIWAWDLTHVEISANLAQLHVVMEEWIEATHNQNFFDGSLL